MHHVYLTSACELRSLIWLMTEYLKLSQSLEGGMLQPPRFKNNPPSPEPEQLQVHDSLFLHLGPWFRVG